MRYRKTQKAVLTAFIVLLAKKVPTRYGNVFMTWCLGELKVKYPLFYWALRNK